jgi:hypothetical protein
MKKIIILTFMFFLSMPALGNPQEQADLYVRYLLNGEYYNIAEMFHPEAAEYIREKVFPVIELEISNNVEASLAQTIFPGESLNEIESYSSKIFTTKFLLFILSAFDEARVLIDMQSLSPPVIEGDIAHVILRANKKGVKAKWENSTLDIISLKKHGADWKILPSNEVSSFVDIYRKKYGL